MSGFNYAVTAATVTRLLARFGGPVTWRQPGLSAYSPATSKVTSTPVNTVVTGAVLDFGAGQTYMRGNLIQGGDKRLLLDSKKIPNLHDQFVVYGTVYEIVSIGEVNLGGTSVMFDVHLRT